MDVNGVPAPDDFPTGLYGKVAHLAETWPDADRNTQQQLRGGWNAVGFRFLAAALSDEAWRDSVAQHGTAPHPEERLRQETAVFGFYVASTAVLESFCYAAFAVGALQRPDAFGEISHPAKQRQITPMVTRDRFQAEFPNARLTRRITQTLASRDFGQMVSIRNVLVHRSLPPRLHFREPGAAAVRPSLWQLEIHGFESLTVTANVTEQPRRWLSRNLSSLMRDLAGFLVAESGGGR